MCLIKVGIVIADDMEYLPVKKLGGEECPYYKHDGHKFTYSGNGNTVEIYTVYSGIGKANAAAAAMYLINNGCSMIFNTGLSGGVSGVGRGELTLGTKYYEHDFNMCVLGYKLAEKPGEKYVCQSDEKLLSYFKKLCPQAKCGVMVTGDSFVSDSKLKEKLINDFSAMSCDMESAAIAEVCYITDTPFLAVRRVSDDAGEDAGEDYREINDNVNFDLAEFVINGVKKMLTE